MMAMMIIQLLRVSQHTMCKKSCGTLVSQHTSCGTLVSQHTSCGTLVSQHTSCGTLVSQHTSWEPVAYRFTVFRNSVLRCQLSWYRVSVLHVASVRVHTKKILQFLSYDKSIGSWICLSVTNDIYISHVLVRVPLFFCRQIHVTCICH